ncbi:MAG: hypothetical protein C4518_04555 [Desulfobacteraceae bacterium]|nr:MAG: hypothetical protein C4518_04555 [Desulfobacteraceae bacterium]
MTDSEKRNRTTKARRLAAVITQNCLTSLCDESARIDYNLQKIHCLGMAAKFYFLKTFQPDFDQSETEIITETCDCGVDPAIMADVARLKALLSS